jgi:homoserine kinase type II
MDNCIRSDLKESFGLTCHMVEPSAGGWMNQLWKVTTDSGIFLVKQYSNKRFNKRDLEAIEIALQRQMIVRKAGVPCPAVRTCNGKVISFTDNGIAYMVMEFCDGKTENPDTITTTQMYELGSACGRMHKAFAELPEASSGGCLPAFGGYTVETLLGNFKTRRARLTTEANEAYRKALLAQEPILKQLNNDFFVKLPKGIAHEDFTAENILFYKQNVSAILDFDRSTYSYVWHDIGRAILSFALKDNQLEIAKINAFLEGYCQYLPLTKADIADSLRLSWCIETPWWIHRIALREKWGRQDATGMRYSGSQRIGLR